MRTALPMRCPPGPSPSLLLPPPPPSAQAAAGHGLPWLRPTGLTVGDPRPRPRSRCGADGGPGGEPRFPVWGKTLGRGRGHRARASRSRSREQGGDRHLGADGWRSRAFRPGACRCRRWRSRSRSRPGRSRRRRPPGLALDGALGDSPAEEKNPLPKPPAPPRPLPLGSRFWWTLAALAALASPPRLLLWRRRRKPRRATAAVPALPPLDGAGGRARPAARPSPRCSRSTPG